MKRTPIIIIMLLLALSGHAKKHRQLVILHTNDTHSQIYPISSQLPDTMKAGRGGFLRRIAMLKRGTRQTSRPVVFRLGRLLPGLGLFHDVQR